MTKLKRGLDRLISLYLFPGATTTFQNDHSPGLDPKFSHDTQDGGAARHCLVQAVTR